MKELKFINVPCIKGPGIDDFLRVFDASNFSIKMERVFTVTANEGAVRGKHAHKQCTQIISCVSGEVNLSVDNGSTTESLRLSTDSDAVFVPPGIWGEQTYLRNKSVLLVICNMPYDEDDYIRDYQEFLNWKSRNK